MMYDLERRYRHMTIWACVFAVLFVVGAFAALIYLDKTLDERKTQQEMHRYVSGLLHKCARGNKVYLVKSPFGDFFCGNDTAVGGTPDAPAQQRFSPLDKRL